MEQIFVSYTSSDRRWSEWIAWQLEAVGNKAILQAWDFQPGSNFVLEMQKAAQETDRTVAVLSRSYLASKYAQAEWAAAFRRDPTGEGRVLIPVRVEPFELSGLLPGIVYIDLFGVDEETARERLLKGLSRDRAKPETAPLFPGEVLGATPGFPGPATTIDSTHRGDPQSKVAANVSVAKVAPGAHDRLDFEFPSFVIGLKASKATATFQLNSIDTTVTLDFRQVAFNITTNSQHATKDDNPFEFHFSGPGTYQAQFEIFVKEAKDLNDLVTVVATSNRVLLRRTYRVSAFTGNERLLGSRLIEPLLRNWRPLVACLALAGLGALFLTLKKGGQDWPTTLGWRAPDYLNNGGAWNDYFRAEDWNTHQGARIQPRTNNSHAFWLDVSGVGFGSPRLNLPLISQVVRRSPTLYDFEAMFNLNFAEDGNALWFFRARSYGTTWNGYRFRLQRRSLNSETQFVLSADRCSSAENCAPLGPEIQPFQICSGPSLVTIRALVKRNELRIKPQFSVTRPSSIKTSANGCSSIVGPVDLSPFLDPKNSFPDGQLVFASDLSESHFVIDYLVIARVGSGIYPAPLPTPQASN